MCAKLALLPLPERLVDRTPPFVEAAHEHRQRRGELRRFVDGQVRRSQSA